MTGTGLRERNRRAAMSDVQTVAMRMMRSAGFSNVTVEQIAEAAGVSPSTVYRYFGTKEALVLWGDQPSQLLETLAATKVGKKRSVDDAFLESAVSVYAADESGLLSQLKLVFANDDLTVAFEHGLIGRRDDLAAVLAAHGGADKASWRDTALAGSMLGMLIAVLDRWQQSDGSKSLAKQLSKAHAALHN